MFDFEDRDGWLLRVDTSFGARVYIEAASPTEEVGLIFDSATARAIAAALIKAADKAEATP